MRLSTWYLGVVVLLLCACRNEKPVPKTDAQRMEDVHGIAGVNEKPVPKTDAQRMEDVHRIAGVIEQYREKTGRYPYAENWQNVEPNMVAIPIGVLISSKQLPAEYRYPPGGRTGAIFPYKEFLGYLRKVLGEDLTLPEDDRDPREWVPYQFAFDGKNYFVSAHLMQPNEFTRPVGGGHKYQVGSIGSAEAKVRAYSEIKP